MILSFWTDRSVCHTIWIFWTHYFVVNRYCSIFKITTAIFLGVRIFSIFTIPFSGNVSSISGSDSDSDLDSDAGRITTSADLKVRPKPAGIPSHLATSGNTSTDSESESGPSEDVAQRLPKVYFRTAEGQLISLYRCVLCHKKVSIFIHHLPFQYTTQSAG